MKKFLIPLLFIFIGKQSFSQSYANWWYFGQNAGVTFQTGSPVASPGGQINTVEGTAAISDASGNRLFYTEGVRVWNRNHVQMPNGAGLMGNISSTQSAVIVQRPGSPNIYYIFTVDAQAGGNGFRWSEVDMNLQGGFGDVTANKNILLYTPSAEKICAIKHCNNTDVWVLSHHFGSNGFRAYLVTAAGINPVSVNSNVGTVHSGSSTNTIGYMKVSPDGNKLALAVRYTSSGNQPGYVEMFDFNNNTGAVTNALVLGNMQYAYGVEFSPNSTLLYVNRSQGTTIYQYNLCAGSNAAIIASQTAVGNSTSGWAGGLQLGPDNKIYMARYQAQWLGVINNPNTVGVGCGYVDNGVPLAPMTSTLGIPTFVQSYFRIPPVMSSYIDTTVNCLLDSLSFTTQYTASCTAPGNVITSVDWDFGDPLSGPNNTSNLMAPVHLFSGSGNYTITLIVNYVCYSDTTTMQVNVISCGPTVTVAGDSICDGTCTNLIAVGSGGTPPYSYTWTPNIGVGAGPHQVCPITTTTYSVLITDAIGDTSSTTATVLVYPLPVLLMTETDVLCNGDTTGTATVTPAGNNPFTYSWNTNPGQITQTAISLPIGNYTVTVTDINGCSQSASITVNEPAPLAVDTSTVSPICTACNGSTTANPSGGTAPYSYSWNTVPVQNTQTATGLCPGNYTVTVTDNNGCTQTASVTLFTTPVALTVNISSQTDALCNGACNGDATAFTNSGTPGYSYLWNTVPPQLTATASSLCAGAYSVVVTDVNGCTGTTVTIISEPQPVVTTASNDVSICFGQSTPLLAAAVGGTPGYNYTWNPGNISGPSINVSPASTTIYIVSTTDVNGCVAVDDSVVVTVNPLPLVLFTPDITSGCSPVCVSFTNQTLNPVSSTWDFGDFSSSTLTNPAHCFNTPGTYDVTLRVTDNNGCTDSLTQFNLISVFQWAAADFFVTPQPPYLSGTALTFNDNSNGATIWSWLFGDPLNSTSQQQNPTFTYDDPDTYVVTLIVNNADNCPDTISHTVRIDAPFDFFVPNTFTPNGDTHNEVFLPMGIGYNETEGYELTIYDRWGAVLFKSKNPSIGWDGRSVKGGDIVPEGVYVWTITVRSVYNNIKHGYLGHVTVVK
jgi:gliding motility-associated-like protein